MRSSYSMPVGLHLGDGLAAGLVLLGVEHLARVVEGGLDDGDDVQRVGGRLGLEQLDRREGKGAERLVEGEVVLQVDGQPDDAALGVGHVEALDDAGREQRPVDRNRLGDKDSLARRRLMVVGEQVAHRLEGVARTADDVEHHGVG